MLSHNNIFLRMRQRDERGFEGGGGEVDAVREQGVEEGGEVLGVRESKSPHAAARGGGDRDVGGVTDFGETVGELSSARV